MAETSFDQSDVEGLRARLEGLELSAGERAALDRLVALAGEAAGEVSGFRASATAGLGDLTGFLSSGHTTGSNVRGSLSGRAPGPSGRGDGIVTSGGGSSI